MGFSIDYFFKGEENFSAQKGGKSKDAGRFGSEVEEELRAQISKLEKDKEFLQEMLKRFSFSYEKIASELGKAQGAEVRRLPLVPSVENKSEQAFAA
jgi:hypothetical protein